MGKDEKSFEDIYPEMKKMAQLLTGEADSILIGSMAAYLIHPEILDHKPHDVDLMIDNTLENIKRVIGILKENGYEVFSWTDEIGEDFDYSILPGRFYIRGIRDGLYVDLTYEIVGLTFEELKRHTVTADGIVTCTTEGLIKTLEVCDRPDAAKRIELLKRV
ncbi:MAG: hypothetical protein K6G06_01370 [Butyrivibrio sp.]|nr:hypothetical protein [Butyrivibrio sp.]